MAGYPSLAAHKLLARKGAARPAMRRWEPAGRPGHLSEIPEAAPAVARQPC